MQPAWYQRESVLIPLLILIGALALLGSRALEESASVGVSKTLAATMPIRPTAPAGIRPSNLAPPPLPPQPQFTDCTGIWRGRYVQAGDQGDFSDFEITQSGTRITGSGATRSQKLGETAAYTIEGTVEGSTVRFVDQLAEPKFMWCDGCVYTGTVNAEFTRIEMRGACRGLCSGIGGTFLLERLPPDAVTILP